MTTAYRHSPFIIHGSVRELAPLACNDPDRDLWYLKVSGSPGLTREQLEHVAEKICEKLNQDALRLCLSEAMRFVPRPEEMSGYGDPDAPEHVQAMIRLAAKLHVGFVNQETQE